MTTPSANQAPPALSIILPIHNEENNLRDIVNQLLITGEKTGGEFELVCVDDGSDDASAEILREISDEDERVKSYHLSRNFGHMAALSAGLSFARASDAVICLDADGQHPPEMIPSMIREWRDGADIVQMIRTRTRGETIFKRWSSKLFYQLINLLSDTRIPDGAADFRLMSREAVDALNSLSERERFNRGLVQWIGFNVKYLDFIAPPRKKGESSYGLIPMLAFAFSGITSFSVRPLRLALAMGLVVIGITATYSVYVLAMYFLGAELITGWSSMILLTAFLNGMVLFALGIIGEYLAHVYIETKGRPVFIVRKNPPSTRGVKSK